MEDLKQDVQYLSNEATQYLDSEMKLAKLELVDTLSSYSASIFSRVILMLLGAISYLLCMIALGVYLTQLFIEPWVGPVLTAGISILILLLVFGFRRFVLEGPFQDYVISRLSKTFIS